MAHEITNQIMLITYADSMGDNLHDLHYVLDTYYEGAVKGLHILPFFPSSADRGFSPMTYREVDPRFGTWDDIMAFSKKYYLMYDYMINHLSTESDIYKDFIARKDASPYRDFFIRYKDFWPGGDATAEQIDKLYKRKAVPYTEVTFADGTKEKLWSTFSDAQMDINIERSAVAQQFMRENLAFLAEYGASMIRLDAFAYASKKPNTNCFFIEPGVWDMMGVCRETLAPSGTLILPEIHEHYFIQKKLEEKHYYTYDFQLPMLLLNAFYFKKTMYLKNWMKICPRTQFTTLDTHDGIGVVDVRYLMPDEDVLATKKKVFEQNPGINEVYAVNHMPINFDRFDTYQINCTYFSALGEDENRYLMARAVQFFTPGIPQVYYCGLFAEKNDFDLFHRTHHHRDINRHYYTLEEIRAQQDRPVVQAMKRLMLLRNGHPAFVGAFSQLPCDETALSLRWENGDAYAQLDVDFEPETFTIRFSDENGEERLFA